MTYLVDDKKFSISYNELREAYILFTEMSDEEFMSKIPQALHLACIICFFKEIPSYICLSDTGVIHELSHIMSGITPVNSISEIRQTFNQTLKLA